MDVTLKILKGAKSGGKIAIKKEKFLIGRSKKCSLCVGTESISRQHCVITRCQSRVTIADLGSRNGTIVNGERIDKPVHLKSGDELAIGPLRFLVTISNGFSNLKRDKVKSIAEAAQRTANTHSTDVQEDDITSWLSGIGTSGSTGSPSITDTQTIRLDDTNATEMKHALEEFAQQEAQTEKNQGPAEKENSSQYKSASNDGKSVASKSNSKIQADSNIQSDSKIQADSKNQKGPGKLPFTPSKPVAKDSCEAAAEALRFWGRRK
jgi:pSer/pThr/pTyr-binding forkhead associated (FHA) protein